MKVYEYLQKQMIEENFFNSLDFISKYVVIKQFFQNLDNLDTMNSKFQIFSTKKQQIFQYSFTSLENQESILANIYMQDCRFSRYDLNFQDENGVCSTIDIRFLAHGIVKVKKEYLENEERIREEQYYFGNTILASRKWKFDVKNKPYLSAAYYYDLDRSCVFLRNYETDERSIAVCRYRVLPRYVKDFFRDYEIPSDTIGIYKLSNWLSKNQFEKQSLGIYHRARRMGSKNSSPN